MPSGSVPTISAKKATGTGRMELQCATNTSLPVSLTTSTLGKTAVLLPMTRDGMT